MTITKFITKNTTASFVAAAAGILLAITLTACKSQQSLTGTWAATGKALENGEQQKALFQLKQDGTQLSGKVRGLGFQTNVKGTGERQSTIRPSNDDGWTAGYRPKHSINRPLTAPGRRIADRAHLNVAVSY